MDGAVAFLTFNRPEARNAMTWEMYDALADACDRVDADAGMRVFVIRGAGEAFVAGTDIASSRTSAPRPTVSPTSAGWNAIIDRLERVAGATIAAGAGRRRRRRLRDRAGLRSAGVHAGAPVRRADCPHARQLSVGGQSARGSST